MKTTVLKRCIAPVLLLSVMQAATAAETYWVEIQSVRYTCASSACGVLGSLREGSKLEVLEVKSGFGRITEQYDAKCVNGRSSLVKAGYNECNAKNGIPNGTVAEWVQMEYLSNQAPSHKH
ncbi:MAG TPA: hypothetical protein VEC01_12665 [Noviherbaspirillum sp.]|uniref:hypothetical protein n=1 Tax=Noviherbaspirillum sp. TaxID=1926288 RepID=UPI002D5BF4D5|nr:hypothetical protein [Noviherbaspirillum sp.]HYD96172.1 hypothetical protein [Noviherbaspirillum sp.]